MGQNLQKNQNLAIEISDAEFYNILPVDTAPKNKASDRSQSAPTPSERHRSVSFDSIITNNNLVQQKSSSMDTSVVDKKKGRNPRKPSISEEGEADETKQEQPTTVSTTTISSEKKRTSFSLFKRKKTNSPTEDRTPDAPSPIITTNTSSKKCVGTYVHKPIDERIRSKSSPIHYDRSIVGGYLHKREHSEPLPDVFLVITPPTSPKPTNMNIPNLVIGDGKGEVVDFSKVIIVCNDCITYAPAPVGRKVGPIIKKKKEKLKEMLDRANQSYDDLVYKTRREICKSRSSKRR